MNNIYKLVVTVLLANVGGYIFGMELSSNSDVVSSDRACYCIVLYNKLEEKKMINPKGFSDQDRETLNHAKSSLDKIGLGYFDSLNELQEIYQKQEGSSITGWVKQGNPKVKRCLLDSGDYLEIIPFTLDDLSKSEESDEESYEYSPEDKALMKALMFENFSKK